MTTPTDTTISDSAEPGPAGPDVVRERSGLVDWQWNAALALGLVPRPVNRVLSAEQVADVLARVASIRTAVGEDRPIGAHRAADRLTERSDVAGEVWPVDVAALVEAGQLNAVDTYKGWPLYAVGQLDALPVDVVDAVVEARVAWVSSGVHLTAAAQQLGWSVRELRDVVAERALELHHDVLAADVVDALAGDEDLDDRVQGERLLTADAGAEHLEVRRADFDHLVRLGMLHPATVHVKEVGRRRTIDVPLYRTRDLDGLLADAPVDWEELRGTKPGKQSPLARLGEPEPSRAAAVRKAMADLAVEFGVGTIASYDRYTDTWDVDFERHPGHAPTDKAFRAAVRRHPALTLYASEISVGGPATAASMWARAMREPGAAVVLDTETTGLDGASLVEIAVRDAADGRVLLDTLVQPGAPVTERARGIHGITDDELAGAPTLTEVWDQVLTVTRGRTVVAYNAQFDDDVIRRHAQRDGLSLEHLQTPGTWACLMNARSDWLRTWSSLPLNGAHRAAGDCAAAVELLAEMTNPAR